MWDGSCVYIHLVLSLAPFASNILAIVLWLSMTARSTGVKSSSLVLCVCVGVCVCVGGYVGVWVCVCWGGGGGGG